LLARRMYASGSLHPHVTCHGEELYMARKLVQCEHCGGKKVCTAAGGKSCDTCLFAAGRRHRDWAIVRCSYCGGRGTVVVEVDEEPDAETKAEKTAGEQ